MLRTRSILSLCVTLFGASSLASGVECKALKSHDTRYTVCQVDLRSDHLELFLNDENGRPFNSFRRISDALAHHKRQLVFAMNAGIYQQNFAPLGLLVVEKHQVHRLNQAKGYGNFYIKPNGVFILSEDEAHPDKARIVETTAYPTLTEPSLRLATQSGPLLVQGGTISQSLNPLGTSRLIRNGVGIVSSDQVVFVISEDLVTFYEFAQMFREALHCTDALYLDGSVSSLYWPALGRNDDWTQLGPIIAVTRDAP
jgi:uncharacterized protein YigE (DUF2233 family)